MRIYYQCKTLGRLPILIHARHTLAVCGLLLLAHDVLGDQVIMNNGDRLTGTVETTRDGKLIFETTYAGEIEIQLAKIQRMVTDNPVTLVLDDDTKVSAALCSTDGTEMEMQADVDSAPQPLAINRIVAVNPPEVPQLKVAGQFNTGAEIDRGNTDKEKYHLDVEALFRWIDSRLKIHGDGDLEYSNSDRTKQKADLAIKHDYFFNNDDFIFHEKWYLWSGALFEHDEKADLNLRTTVGLGLGYQVFETERTELSVQAGPSYIRENLDSSDNNDYVSALWALDFKHQLFKHWKLSTFHNHDLRWSVESENNYVFKSESGLRIPIYDRLQVTLQINFDRNNAPADNAKKNDYETLITGGYAW